MSNAQDDRIVSEKEISKDPDVVIDLLPRCYLVKLPDSLQKFWGFDKKELDNSMQARIKRGAPSKMVQEKNKDGIEPKYDMHVANVIIKKNNDGTEELVGISVPMQSSEQTFYKYIPTENKLRVPQLIASISPDQVDVEVTGIISSKGDLRVDEKYASKIYEKIRQGTILGREKPFHVASMDMHEERLLQAKKASEVYKTSVSFGPNKKRERDDEESGGRKSKIQKNGDGLEDDDFIFQKLLKAFASPDQNGEKRTHISISDLASLMGMGQESLRPHLKKYCDCPQSGENAHKYGLKPQYIFR